METPFQGMNFTFMAAALAGILPSHPLHRPNVWVTSKKAWRLFFFKAAENSLEASEKADAAPT